MFRLSYCLKIQGTFKPGIWLQYFGGKQCLHLQGNFKAAIHLAQFVWNRMAPQRVYRSLTHCMSRVPGKFACRILIQEIGFALPVTITVPVVVSLLITFWGLRFGKSCPSNDIIPNYLFFKPPEFDDLGEFITKEVRKHCLLQKIFRICRSQ